MCHVTMLAGKVDLEHGHADGVIDGIYNALALVRLSRDTLKSTKRGPSLVCLNFDGASLTLKYIIIYHFSVFHNFLKGCMMI